MVKMMILCYNNNVQLLIATCILKEKYKFCMLICLMLFETIFPIKLLSTVITSENYGS